MEFENSHVGSPPGMGGVRRQGGLDRKDPAVWKLEDGVDKLRFRHWVQAVENNLEHVHDWDRASEILDRVRRHEVEIDEDRLDRTINQAQSAAVEAG